MLTLVLPSQVGEPKQAWECHVTWPQSRKPWGLHLCVQLVLSVPLDADVMELWLDCGHDGWDLSWGTWILTSLLIALLTSPTTLRIFDCSLRKGAEISSNHVLYYLAMKTLIWRHASLNRRDNFWPLWLLVFSILERLIPHPSLRVYQSPFQIWGFFYLLVFPILNRTLESWTSQNSCHTGSTMLTLGPLIPTQHYQFCLNQANF